MQNPNWLFPSSAGEAKRIQEEMVRHSIMEDQNNKFPSYIAGVDVSNNRFDPKKMIFAAVVVLEFPSLNIVEYSNL